MVSRRWLDGGGPGITGVDVWRLEDGLVVEGWEVIEPVGDATANFTWWQPAGSTV
jgi:predicted SnoaL-like aldol condensation-catalyzing enzyme